MPSAAYFPLSELSAETLAKDSFALSPTEKPQSLSWFWRLFSSGRTKERTEHLTIPKYATSKDEVSLEVALQYGTAQGLVPLQNFIHEFTKRVYQPQYEDFRIFMHAGNTAAWTMAVMTFCNPGEVFLTEEWTYPSAMSTARPLGVSPVPVEIDGEGMKSDSLRKLLAEWDEEKRGAKRYVSLFHFLSLSYLILSSLVHTLCIPYLLDRTRQEHVWARLAKKNYMTFAPNMVRTRTYH